MVSVTKIYNITQLSHFVPSKSLKVSNGSRLLWSIYNYKLQWQWLSGWYQCLQHSWRLCSLSISVGMSLIKWVLNVNYKVSCILHDDKMNSSSCSLFLGMYYTVQFFTLALKINFFFEVLLMAFYAVCASLASRPLCIAASVLAGVSLFALLVGRQAVTYSWQQPRQSFTDSSSWCRLLGKLIGWCRCFHWCKVPSYLSIWLYWWQLLM